MPDKLNNAEIKKALECCNQNDCKTCPYGKYNVTGWCCMPKVRKDALDLINRYEEQLATFESRNKALKTERNRLNKEITKQKLKNNMLYEETQAEIERLKEEVAKEFTCFVGDPHKVEHCPYLEQLKTAKAEAYKECVEKVKANLSNIAKIDWQGNYYYLVGLAFFDNLLKEMGVEGE